MAEGKKNSGLGLPQTKGSFQVRGKVTGTQKDNFFIEKLTKTDKPWRSTSFGVQYAEDETIYVGLNGMERDVVYFTKRAEENGGKSTTKEVPWKDRFTFKEKDFNLIGVNLGVSKVIDAKGKEVNDKKRMVEFDACKEISDHLTDDQTVFVKGSIEYSVYNEQHRVNFVPSQVSLGKNIDFMSEDFKPMADFTQTIVFMGITMNQERTKATVAAKIVNYNSIEDAEFFITDLNLANLFRSKLKPYTSIKVWGNIRVTKQVEEVQTTDCWGTENDMEKIKEPVIRELIITGADPTTIDTTTYAESEIDAAIERVKASRAAENDFGSSKDDWGSLDGFTEIDDEDDAWS